MQSSLKQHRQVKQEKNDFNVPYLNSHRPIREKIKQFMNHCLTGLKVEGRWEEEVGISGEEAGRCVRLAQRGIKGKLPRIPN